MSTLYYGDNLTILREHARENTVDLVTLDPALNANPATGISSLSSGA